MLLSWLLVYPLSKTSCRPEWLVLLGFICRVGVGILCTTGQAYDALTIILLLASVILDYADGQLARYTGQVSDKGGLYDLASDFFGSFIMFGGIFFALIQQPDAPLTGDILLCTAALFAYYISCTIASFTRFRWVAHMRGTSTQRIRRKFIFGQDEAAQRAPTSHSHGLVLRLFRISWMAISRLLLAFPVWRNRPFHPAMLHLYAFGFLSIHWFFLAFTLVFRLPLETFLWGEITVCLALSSIVWLTERS